MRRMMLAMLLLVAGCDGDPARSVLGPGARAILYDPHWPVVAVAMEDPGMEGEATRKTFAVPVGTRVTVLADEAPEGDVEAPDYRGRPVRIHVAEGEHRGVTTVGRHQLRPIR